jgi:uncharacterized membrane protein
MDAQGTTLVGFGPSGRPAVRWTADTGIDALDGAGSVTGDFARGVSADGSVIVGRARGAAFIDTRPFRWTASTGMVPLAGELFGPESQHPAGSDIYATGVSDDGNVIVGTGCIPFVGRRLGALRIWGTTAQVSRAPVASAPTVRSSSEAPASARRPWRSAGRGKG